MLSRAVSCSFNVFTRFSLKPVRCYFICLSPGLNNIRRCVKQLTSMRVVWKHFPVAMKSLVSPAGIYSISCSLKIMRFFGLSVSENTT